MTPAVGFGYAVGGDTTGYSVSHAVATDAAGNAYITGFFQGTLHLGSTTLTSSSSNDAFMAKYSSTGACVWAAHLGAGAIASGSGIAVDSTGNVYTTGFFQGTGNFRGRLIPAPRP